ncbi:amylo-alpha-1,6-glucosidase [Natronosporangium hydrolyticum]|uniref:Amylo-alpha-1,6-glucosidase n=1 Tax=Natronosporangium hydrolyticum TaxID=2811111 RepID=A0A895Y9L1_9ACTN|nr:glycogen debranching N-terminal domain-containing protein [Natronosporangium hydrolyticum]QSB12952.1 amylo-alpha-1,6-glucosidase [Natronosporangium hydrolyticum]
MPAPLAQPYLHELVTCVQAPTLALSDPDGQIRTGGAEGLFHRDRRILSELLVDLDGQPPVAVGHHQPDAATGRFVSVVRHLGDPGADPTVRLERDRRLLADGMCERLLLINDAREAVTTTVRVTAGVDFATLGAVKHGEPTAIATPQLAGEAQVRWEHGSATSTMHATGEPEWVPGSERVLLHWRVTVPAHQRWSATLTITTSSVDSNPAAFAPAATTPGFWPIRVTGPYDLVQLVERSVSDLAALTLADPAAPADAFAAAGSPWFLTLFGRDSLWTARLTLPLGTDLAAGTLRALARRQGTRHDPATAEEPGKIPHEIRGGVGGVGGLPPVYYGTVDATALWICLLHDAWRWGMPTGEVASLLQPLQAALNWLVVSADDDGDGFLDYFDHSGRGLVNQGWKDSGDAIQFPDGTIAEPPIALSEAQAYAYEAAMSGAALLSAFDLPGAADARRWAARLADRFRETFWVDDARGRFPAMALEGAKRPVPTAASNLGHLLGTGLLDPTEEELVAARLRQPDLDCGYGLRTLSADATGFNPFGYHAGTVWPHDTAIAVRGLIMAGQPAIAASFATGLLRAAPVFAHRLPELYAGTDAAAGEPVLAYPAACRPQAWSAAATISLLRTALGLRVDVPNQRLTVSPCPELAAWFPLRISGLRLAGEPLTVTVDAAGEPQVQTTAPVTVIASTGKLVV